jgi:hypothetical protein
MSIIKYLPCPGLMPHDLESRQNLKQAHINPDGIQQIYYSQGNLDKEGRRNE